MSSLRKVSDLARCMAFQWLPWPVIAAYKLHRLKRVLRHAEQRVPLYREKFRQAGVSARDFRAIDDLRWFPTLTREEVIAAYPDRILSRPPRARDVVFRTSGTSGQFMQIAYSARANDFLDAVYGRALFNAGYKPWDRIAYYWWEPEPRPLRSYERLGLMKKDFLPIHADPARQLADLDALNPDVVYHFPSALLMITRILERERGQHRFKPRLAICHGEFMAEEQQTYMERVLGCPVHNEYGAQEFNRMGWDCSEQRGLHEDSDSVHIEILVDDKPAQLAEEGEVVVTGLVNDLMPLIRYRIGDAGLLLGRDCGCGRALPRYTLTEGRLDDVLELPDGSRVGPRTLAPRIEQLRGFHQYRVIQIEPDVLEVLLVREPGAGTEVEEQVRRVVLDVVGPKIKVSVQSVPSIELSRRGKLRKIVRRIPGSPPARPAPP
jgi:phenylacetate-CoA ligase